MLVSTSLGSTCWPSRHVLVSLLVQVRYRREHASGRQLPHFPLLEDLMRDVSDGAALLTVVHYYCPDLMKLDGTLSKWRFKRVSGCRLHIACLLSLERGNRKY